MFNKGEMKFEICPVQKKKDIEMQEPKNTRMARLCKVAMYCINLDLSFTTEVPEDFPENKLPTLDFVLWLFCGLILHSYLEKSMRTPYVIMRHSAMSEHQRISILCNELVRRLSNVHPDVVDQEISFIVEHYFVQLKASGYDR